MTTLPGGPAAPGPALAQAWQRLLALGLDWLVVTVAGCAVWVPAIAIIEVGGHDLTRRFPPGSDSPAEPAAIGHFVLTIFLTLAGGFLLIGVLAYCYFWLQHGRYGQTLGQRALRIRVITAAGWSQPSYSQAAGRAAVLVAVPLIPFLGPLFAMLDAAWLLWDPARQTLHDKAAGTIVVAAGPAQSGPGSGLTP